MSKWKRKYLVGRGGGGSDHTAINVCKHIMSADAGQLFNCLSLKLEEPPETFGAGGPV